jgi:hypothetical protein
MKPNMAEFIFGKPEDHIWKKPVYFLQCDKSFTDEFSAARTFHFPDVSLINF